MHVGTAWQLLKAPTPGVSALFPGVRLDTSNRRPHGGESPESGAFERLHEGRPVEKGGRVTKICTSILVTPGATGAIGRPVPYGHSVSVAPGAHDDLVHRIASGHRLHVDLIDPERAGEPPDLVLRGLRRLGQTRPAAPPVEDDLTFVVGRRG